jgi:sec-independent protein translocase protein TatA
MPLLAGLGPLGVPELIIIAFIVVLVFGVGRLPEVGSALGKGIREFRKASKDEGADPAESSMSSSATEVAPQPAMANVPPAASPPAQAPVAAGTETRFCSDCGAKNGRAAKFCSECGHSMDAGTR